MTDLLAYTPRQMPATAAEPDRIIVVDDNEALRDNICEILEERGAQVHTFANARQAMEFARQSSFDLALVDVQLPDGSGVALIPALKEVEPHCAVILVTGNATIDTAIAAVGLGAFAYVQKPFAVADLVTRSTQALDQVKLLRERAALTRELARSEALYRGIFDTSKALIFGLDALGRVRMMNTEAEYVSGIDDDGARGRDFAELVTFEGGAAAVAGVIRRATEGERVEIETTLTSGDGQKRRGEGSVSPRGVPRGPEEIVLGVGIDVTERREAERRAMQNEALAAMGALTLGLAHEIRNPLNAATLQLELLGRAGAKLVEPPAREAVGKGVRIVKAELGRLERMLSEFLYLARPRGLESVPFVLAHVLRDVAELEEPLATEIGVDIRVESPDDSLSARGDREKMKQLLINLVVNALDALRGPDATGRGGTITLGSRALDRSTVEVSVEDTGPGIPAAVLHTIFEPFVTTKKAGTGLGLPIAKRIVEQHGGTITLESPETGGTTARITLPRA